LDYLDVWAIYQLISESPKSFSEYSSKAQRLRRFTHLDGVSHHNLMLMIEGVLLRLGVISIPTPLNWEKPVMSIDGETGETIKLWNHLPKGHWKIYIKKAITKSELKAQLSQSYF